MSGIKDQEKIEEVRRRLYERGAPSMLSKSHELHDVREEVPSSWQKPPERIVRPIEPPVAPSTAGPSDVYVDMPTRSKKVGYRVKILLAGVGFW